MRMNTETGERRGGCGEDLDTCRYWLHGWDRKDSFQDQGLTRPMVQSGATQPRERSGLVFQA